MKTTEDIRWMRNRIDAARGRLPTGLLLRNALDERLEAAGEALAWVAGVADGGRMLEAWIKEAGPESKPKRKGESA